MRENQPLIWPPPHSVRRSRRARTVSIKISSRRGLEVILPMRCRLEELEHILNEKREWIEKNADLLHKFNQSSSNKVLPEQIWLASCQENWKVSYFYSPIKTQLILRPNHEITLLGNIEDQAHCFALIKKWLKQKAQQILSPILFALSQELRLTFTGLSIRAQKTRWGSCSSQKKISLNYKLIFLSPELVKHVLIHELCHTVHLNHSPQFWRLVAKHDPQWRLHHRLSKKEEMQLPVWVDGD